MRGTVLPDVPDTKIIKLKKAVALKHPKAMFGTGVRSIPYSLMYRDEVDVVSWNEFGSKSIKALIDAFYAEKDFSIAAVWRKEAFVGDPIFQRGLAGLSNYYKNVILDPVQAWLSVKKGEVTEIGLRIQNDAVIDGHPKFRAKGTISYPGPFDMMGNRVRAICKAAAKNLMLAILTRPFRTAFFEKIPSCLPSRFY